MKRITIAEEAQYADMIVKQCESPELVNIKSLTKTHTIRGNYHWFYFDRLYSILRQAPKGKVLDVACGCGLLSVILALYGHKVTAVDISKDSIDYAKKLATLYKCIDNIDFRVMDVSKLSFESESFDIVTGEDALHHIIKYPGAVENIYRVLKIGGKAYFKEPFAFNPFINIMRFINVRFKNHLGEYFLGRRDLKLLNSCFDEVIITDKSVVSILSRFFAKSSKLNRKINIYLKEFDDYLQSKIPFISKYYAYAFMEMKKK